MINGYEPLSPVYSEASRDIHLWIIDILYFICKISVCLYTNAAEDAMQTSTANSRTGRYIARVKAHLPGLMSDAARRRFICGEIDKWEERYTRFVATEGESHRFSDASDQPTAFDFVETLTALGVMQARLTTDRVL